LTQQNLNVGALPNDGTGDEIRVAMIKVQNNFTDLYTNYVSNTQLIANLALYQTLAGLSSNVINLTANNTTYVGTLPVANVVSNAQLIANLANYQTTAGLSANVLVLTSNSANFIGSLPAANVVSSAQLASNLSNYQLISGMTAYQTTAGLAANVALLASNNSLYLGGVAAASYQLNSTLAANVALLAANNASYLGGVPAASYVNTTGTYVFSNIHTHNANLVVNTSSSFILNGNVYINNTINANGSVGTGGYALLSGGPGANVYWGFAGINTATQYTWSNTQTFSGNVTMSGVINTTTANVLNQTITFSSPNTVWYAINGTIATLTLTGNTTLTISGPTIQTYILYVKQDSTGSRYITWGSNFKWASGIAPVLTTNANATDLISFISDGTNMYGSFLPNVK